jgi:hypothetical protein
MNILSIDKNSENDQNLNILIQLILIQSINNGCDFCHEVKDDTKVKRSDGKLKYYFK